ncbi:MAG: hypothetical protein FJ010_12940 [Chloroflexi bacterium]|nr:hypothetical protein [Chloroflexota bacterium]
MKIYRYGWLILLLLAALACNAVNDIAEKAGQVESAAQTAQAFATAGQEILTQVEGSGVVQTAEAMGLMETMLAAITDLPKESTDMMATAQAVLTEGAFGETPSNIPVVSGEVNDFIGSSNLVSYTTPMDLQDVVDFYRDEMPNYGWSAGDDTTVLTSTYAVLSFENASQRCTVTLTVNPLDGSTVVVISIF